MTIYDPRRPDILLWLSVMEPEDAAPLMMAMRETFPILRGNRQWARDIEAVCAGMSETQRQAHQKRAARLGARIMDELTAALGYRPYLR